MPGRPVLSLIEKTLSGLSGTLDPEGQEMKKKDRRIPSTLSKLSSLAKAIASGHYRDMDADDLFAMTEEKYPPELRELAEAFGMMMVKVEAREFRLEETVAELEEANRKLKEYSEHLKDMVAKRTKELEEANRKLERRANIDGLTHIANRRYMDEYLQKHWNRLKREKKPLALIMADIDHFKGFNDTYGHQEGDECLKTIARILDEKTRRSDDLAARYGGEEFAVLLPGTGIEAAMDMAEDIRREVESLKIPNEKNTASPFVTISLGVTAGIPGENGTPDELIERADEALYVAKKERGRNCTVKGRTLGSA